MKKDYYEVLGVSKTATQKEIKSKYRELVRKYHPDVVPENEKETAKERMAEINEAYQVLGDEEKRANYDRFGTADNNAHGFGGFGGINFEDLFNNPFMRRNADGANIFVQCNVTIEELYHGVTKEVEFNRTNICTDCRGTGSKSYKSYTCTTCHGKGNVQEAQHTPFGVRIEMHNCTECNGTGREKPPIDDICTSCHGVGKVNTVERIHVEIPKGNFNDIIIPNMGYVSNRGGKNGNLIVQLSIDNSGKFKIKDRMNPQNLYTTCTCSYSDLVLGNTITIEHFDTKLSVVIPKGTNVGARLRCAGKGLPYPDSNNYGDLFVELALNVPKKLNKKQEKILEKLKENGL